jgi:hypothetical protein
MLEPVRNLTLVTTVTDRALRGFPCPSWALLHRQSLENGSLVDAFGKLTLLL